MRQKHPSRRKSSSPEEIYVQCVAVLRFSSGKWSIKDVIVSHKQTLFSQRTVANDNQCWASTLLLALVIVESF